MATNDDKVRSSPSDYFKGILFTGVGAGGLYYANKSGSLTAPLNSIAPPGNSALGSAGREIGKNLSASRRAKASQRQKAADKFIAEIMDKSALQEMFQETSQIKATIQSLMISMDDPASGLDSNIVAGYKMQLLSIAEKLEQNSDVREVLSGLIHEVFENNAPALEVFRTRLGEHRKFGNQFEIPIKNEFTPLRGTKVKKVEQLTARARRNLSEVQSLFGSEHASFDVVSFNEVSGQNSQYVRVYRRGRSQRDFITMIALDTGFDEKKHPFQVVRTGEAGTANVADRKIFLADRLLDSGTGDHLTQQHLKSASIDVPEYQMRGLREFMKDSRGSVLTFNKNRYHSYQRETLGSLHRSTGMPGAMGAHLGKATEIQYNTARIVGLEGKTSDEKKGLLRKMSRTPYFDLGVGPGRLSEQRIVDSVSGKWSSERRSFAVNISSNAPINLIQTGYQNIPGNFEQRILNPIVSRLEQVTGRLSQASRFVPRVQTGLPSGASLFEQLGAVDNPIMWDSDRVSGGINKAVLLDVGASSSLLKAYKPTRGTIYEGMEGKGQVYKTGSDVLQHSITVPILDPEYHGHLSTALMNRIMKKGEGGRVRVTRGELEEFAGLLGEGPAGNLRHLTRDPRFITGEAYIQGISEASGKKMIHVGFDYKTKAETYKVFGRMVKATAVETSRAVVRREAAKYGVDNSLLARIGLDKDQLIIGSGEMLKKAPDTFVRQILTGYGLVSQDADWQNLIENYFNKEHSSASAAAKALASISGENRLNPIGLAFVSSVKKMAEKGVSAEDAGRVLAAVMNRGIKGDEDSWLKGEAAKYGLDMEAAKTFIKEHYGKDAKKVMRSAASGLAVGADYQTHGEGVGSWKQAMASIEPRTIEMMRHRLDSLGLSNEETSNLIASMYKRKSGGLEDIEVAGKLSQVMGSLKNRQNPLGDFGDSNEFRRMSLTELVEEMETSGSSNLSEYLKKSDQDILVDLGRYRQLEKADALERVAKETFEGSSEILLPGKSFFENNIETHIRVGGGENSIRLDNYVESSINHLWGEIEAFIGADQHLPQWKEGVRALGSFKEEIALATASSIKGISKGSVKGSAFHVAEAYDLDHGSFLSSRERKLAKRVMNITNDQAVFYDDKAFISHIKNFIESGKEYNEQGKIISNPKKEARFIIERFFTGLEDPSKVRGTSMLGGRHPMLSRGNLAVFQLFRDVRAVGNSGKKDEVFHFIKNTEWGRKALSGFEGEKIYGFKNIASSKNKKAKRDFFNSVVENIDAFYFGEGGGRAFVPVRKMEFEIKGKDKKYSFDTGFAQAAVGDMDGDQYGFYMLNRVNAKSVNRATRKMSQAYKDDETIYRMKSGIYEDEMKKALGRMKQGVLHSEQDKIFFDALKEKASKEATPIIDNALDLARKSVLNYEKNNSKVSGALALLKVLEEHTTIKGKKAEKYLPFAEMVATSLEHLLKTGEKEPLDRVFKNYILKGSDLLTESFEIAKVDGRGSRVVSDSVVGKNISFLEDYETIVKSIMESRKSGSPLINSSSTNALASALASSGPSGRQAYDDVIVSGQKLESGISGEVVSKRNSRNLHGIAEKSVKAQNFISNIQNVLMDVNRKNMGLAVGGLAASAGVASLMFNNSVDSGVYETRGASASSSNVSAAINRASSLESSSPVLSSRDNSVNLNMLKSRPSGIPGQDAIINEKSTYIEPSNAYSLTGEVSGSGDNANLFARGIEAIGFNSGTSIRVNDTRRPITGSYYDRAVGEY